MGVVSEKSLLEGLYGGFTTAKNGNQYLSVISQGPKIHKVRVKNIPVIPPVVHFGTPICAELFMAEVKFQDFNGSFTEADSVKIIPPKAV